MNKLLKKLFVVLAPVLLLCAGYIWFLGNKENERTPFSQTGENETESYLSQTEREQLITMIHNTIDWASIKREDEITFEEINDTATALKGKWLGYDHLKRGTVWHWIAWKDNDGNWNTAVAFTSGFYCHELDKIPSHFDDFFHNVIYTPSEYTQPGVRFCMEGGAEGP